MSKLIESKITAQLRALPKADQRTYAKQIATLYSAGLTTIRVMPKGIPVPDGVDVAGVVTPSELQKILGKLVGGLPHGGRVEVFPYGIVNPEAFSINVRLR
jgi:hypothetical protein